MKYFPNLLLLLLLLLLLIQQHQQQRHVVVAVVDVYTERRVIKELSSESIATTTVEEEVHQNKNLLTEWINESVPTTLLRAGSTGVASSTTTTTTTSLDKVYVTPSLSISNDTTLISSSSSSSFSCHMMGYKIWLQSGYDPQWLLSGRISPQILHHHDYVCSESQVGDNIEVVMMTTDDNDCDAIAGMQIILQSRNTTSELWETFDEAIVRKSPYFLYNQLDDDNNTTTRIGRTLPVGEYQIIAHTLLQQVGDEDASDRRDDADDSFRMNFEMIYCAYYQPKNECYLCSTNDQTCEGSQCVTTSPNGIRFVLLTYGQDVYDVAMNITSPYGTIIDASYHSPTDNDNATTMDDPTTGGYIDKNYMETSCRSTGVWIKNIIYPHYIPGIYNVTLTNRLVCSFMGPPFFGNNGAPPNQNHFVVKVYQQERLITTISETANDMNDKIYTFHL